MDRTEARSVLLRAIAPHQPRSWSDLRDQLAARDVLAWSVQGPSGTEWQIELTTHWDSVPDGAIRVLVSIDDGTLLGGLRPECTDWIVDPAPVE